MCWNEQERPLGVAPLRGSLSCPSLLALPSRHPQGTQAPYPNCASVIRSCSMALNQANSLICCSKKEQHIIKLEKHLSVPNFWRMVYWHHHGAILGKFLRVTTVGVMCPLWIWCVSWKLHYFDWCTFGLRGFIFLQVDNRYLYFSIVCFGNGLWHCFSDCGPRTCLGITLDAGFKCSSQAYLWSIVSRVALVSAPECTQDPFISTNIYTPILLSVTTQCASATVLLDVCLGNIN